jgi:hypothetical protein
MVNNKRIRSVLDTITSKVVLILGRFTEERKAVLDAVREELRRRGCLPVLFDFVGAENLDATGTVTLLAKMARFIIADLTEPKSVAHELAVIVLCTVVAIKPILLKGQTTYTMFHDYYKGRNYILPIYEYEDVKDLMANLGTEVISPTEECVSRLRSSN